MVKKVNLCVVCISLVWFALISGSQYRQNNQQQWKQQEQQQKKKQEKQQKKDDDEDISIDIKLGGDAKKGWTLKYGKGNKRGRVTFTEGKEEKKGEVDKGEIIKLFQGLEEKKLFDLKGSNDPTLELCKCVTTRGKMKITKGGKRLDINFRYERSALEFECPSHDDAKHTKMYKECKEVLDIITGFIEIYTKGKEK